MTVLLPKRASKTTSPAVTRRQAKEAAKLRELNPQANTKLQKKVETSCCRTVVCDSVVLVKY